MCASVIVCLVVCVCVCLEKGGGGTVGKVGYTQLKGKKKERKIPVCCCLKYACHLSLKKILKKLTV